MATADPIEALVDRMVRSRRFAELPRECGKQVPGILDVAEWQDWTSLPTTPDQLRIESYLDRMDLTGSSILHVGAGNSGLALHFASRAKTIVGTTIAPAEVSHGEELGIPNYRIILHNKYSGENKVVAGKFDFIVDNNPTSYCCCMRHFAALLDFYRSRLAPAGQLITDRGGLGWTPKSPDRNPKWEFSFDDFAACAYWIGLKAYRIDRHICALMHKGSSDWSPRLRANALLRALGNTLGKPAAKLFKP